MQRTLKRELKVLEIVKREGIGISTCPAPNQAGPGRYGGRLSAFVVAWRLSGAVRDRLTLVQDVSASVGGAGQGSGEGGSASGLGRWRSVIAPFTYRSHPTEASAVTFESASGGVARALAVVAGGDCSQCLFAAVVTVREPHALKRCWPNGSHSPVLKHGPRSLTYVRVFGWQTRDA